MFIILRDAVLSTGAQFGLNPGIIAHEFGHRIFHQNVWGQTRETFERMVLLSTLGNKTEEEQKAVMDSLCTDPTPLDSFPDCAATSILLNGLDEGICDVYAYTFTGVPDFYFSRSIDPDVAAEPLLRDLSLTPNLEGDMPVYARNILVGLIQENAFQYYRLGTLWSRGFYAGIVNPVTGARPTNEAARTQWSKEHYVAAVLRAQRRLGQDLLVEYRFEPQQFMRRYIEEVSRNADGTFNSVVHDAVCQALCDRFGSDQISHPVNGAVAQCAGMNGNNLKVEPSTFACQL